MEKGNSALLNQTIKLFKHTRSGSYATRDRYLKSCKTFVAFLDKEFKMKSLRNLQDKHIVAYISWRQSEGIADKTLKNDLGAIRFLHDMVPNVKHQLSTNQQLATQYNVQLDRTIQVNGDRAWTHDEYEGMLQLLSQQSKDSPIAALTKDIMVLSRTMGLRISEAVCMRRSQAENAIKTGTYQVLGEAKNGLHRSVPLSPEARSMLLERLPSIPRGSRVFVAGEEKAHKVVNRLEKYLERHRDAVTTSEGISSRITLKDDTNPLTYHGLRYNYVQERMTAEQNKGLSWDAAARIVTREVGHGRVEVIKIYTNGK